MTMRLSLLKSMPTRVEGWRGGGAGVCVGGVSHTELEFIPGELHAVVLNMLLFSMMLCID